MLIVTSVKLWNLGVQNMQEPGVFYLNKRKSESSQWCFMPIIIVFSLLNHYEIKYASTLLSMINFKPSNEVDTGDHRAFISHFWDRSVPISAMWDFLILPKCKTKKSRAFYWQMHAVQSLCQPSGVGDFPVLHFFRC